MKTRIYVCGSHSVGKTTLCRELTKHLDYEGVPEAAREIINAQKLDFAAMDRDVEAKDDFQQAVWERHLEMHAGMIDLLERGNIRGVVFDRGLDFLVYAAGFSTLANEQFEHEDTVAYLDALRHSEALVLLLEPHEDLLQNDGVRAAMSMRTAEKITFGIKCLLEVLGIPYIHVTQPDTLERVKMVANIASA